jgi:hypothetical protein
MVIPMLHVLPKRLVGGGIGAVVLGVVDALVMAVRIGRGKVGAAAGGSRPFMNRFNEIASDTFRP